MARRITKVAGVTFHKDYPGNFHKWAQLPPDRLPQAHLIREPKNPADANAVAVKVGRSKIGHLPSALAAEVAPAMDAGRGVAARIVSVDVWESVPMTPTMTLEIFSTGETTDT